MYVHIHMYLYKYGYVFINIEILHIQIKHMLINLNKRVYKIRHKITRMYLCVHTLYTNLGIDHLIPLYFKVLIPHSSRTGRNLFANPAELPNSPRIPRLQEGIIDVPSSW
jgi:hypothetical protein